MWGLNDLKSQFNSKTQKMCSEDIHDTIYDMEHCHHLFVKLEEGKEFLSNHSSDCEKDPPIVECVHCGITNKFMEMEEAYKKLALIALSQSLTGRIKRIVFKPKVTLESLEFKKQFSDGGKRFDDRFLNYISREELNTYHPGLLFRLALNFMLSINLERLTPDDKKKIFRIMKELDSMETDFEREHLMYPMECSDLLARYRDYKGIKIIKK